MPLNHPSFGRRVTRTLVPAAIFLAACAASRAPFHLHLVKSAPEANATVTTAPDSVRLWFSQRPELAVTSVKVTGPAQSAVALAPLARGDSALVIAPVKGKMATGSYTVAWRTMSKDGHAVRGTFSFRVASANGTASR